MSDDNNESGIVIRQDAKREIDGMRQIADALDGLPPETCKRMLTWAADKYCNCVVCNKIVTKF